MAVFRSWCLVISVLLSAVSAEEPEWPQEQLDDFEKQIRPVLAAQCWNCHGEKKAESGLRLDSRAAVLQGGDRGKIVSPREVSAGLLMHAIRRDGDLQMPPNGRLSTEQIAAFSTWIANGLPWPRESAGSAMAQAWKSHWAFQTLHRSPVPVAEVDDWSRTPVDRFILQKQPGAADLERRLASRNALIRRATFDLIGLPPTPDDVTEFEADSSPDAFERLLDRLLASPRYGERWGRYWLDVARFADTKGYVFFEEKSYPWAYTYRDYVIRSLNDDKPYNQFVVEQIAADQLDAVDGKTLAALGFLTVGGHFMGNIHDIVDDRIDVVSRGLMGLTVTCARCHDHKYDPIPTADYYSLYGVFRSSTEPLVLPLSGEPPRTPDYDRFTSELSVRRQRLDDFVALKHTDLVEGARRRAAEYLLAARAASEKPATDDFMLLTDPGELNPAMIIRWQAYLEKLSAAGPTDSVEGTGATHPVWGPWLALSKLPEDGFATAAKAWLDHAQRMNIEKPGVVNLMVLRALAGKTPSQGSPKTVAELADRYGDLLQSVHVKWQNLVRDAVIRKRPAPEHLPDWEEEQVRLELYGEQAPANIPQVFGWGFLSLLPDRPSQGEYQKLLKEVEQWLIHGPSAPSRSMILEDGPLHEARVFVRGNPSRPGEPVQRHFLSIIEPDNRPFKTGSGRLELARAIASPGNPLTARVAVNRLWQHHFGAGLVRTPGDFGMRSDSPTHPELLDWLACDLIGRGERESAPWTLKRVHRRLMSSAVYQQSSQASPEMDPENRLWRHANRTRLDFEATRDALLSITGELDDRIGGPSQSMLQGEFVPRRTLYAYVDRENPPGLLSVFDVPSPVATSSTRDTTTVSPQALYLMNGPLAPACAERLIMRLDAANLASTTQRVERIYQILFARSPEPAEMRLANKFLGERPALPAWKQFAQALLMTNEFVFVD